MDLSDGLRASGATRRRSAVRTSDIVIFDGGLNLTDPPLSVAPGHLLGVKNYEPGIRGGYARVDGYERIDGRTSPTNGAFWTLRASDAVALTAGATIRGYAAGDTATPLATGTLAYVADAGGGEQYLVVVNASGDFADGQDIRHGVSAPGTLVGEATYAKRNDAPSDDLTEEFIAQKAEYLRSLIGPVGGAACSGPVRGVAILADGLYAFRDNAAASAGTMWKATASGWVQQSLGLKLTFTAGTLEVAEGQTINGLTSGATAVARRVVSDDGTYAGGDATGYIIITAATGTFAPGETLRVGTTAVATLGTATAQALPAGGYYRFRRHNFFGARDQTRLYGVNGVGNGFEWDGEVFVLISTGMANDKPTHLFQLNDHLFYCYPGGSIQNSGYQRPLNWSPILGADERSVGGTVTDVSEELNRTVIIGTRQTTHILAGDVVENFQLRLYSPETGIIENTIARLGQTIYLDDRGYTALRATASYGNFAANSMSDKILSLVQSRLTGLMPVAAQIVRRKNIYRSFFSDGSYLCIGMRPGGRYTGWTDCKLLVNVTCAESAEFEVGAMFAERCFVGADNGYVYETDIGRSFDGQDIEAFARLSYHNSRSIENFKRYRRAQIDADISGPTTIFATVDYNYGNRDGQAAQELDFRGGGGFWDVALWDQFSWSGQAFDQIVIKIEGEGYNIGLFFYHRSARQPSHTLYNVSYQSSMRRINRGTQEG